MTQTFSLPSSSEVELVRRYGGPVSHAALAPMISTFRIPDIDGLIGFLAVHRCAVVLGDPLCVPERQAQLADAFGAHCADNHWSVIYVAATETIHTYALERGYGAIEFADLLLADPRHDPEAGARGRHIRQNLNHTRRLGVTVREYLGEESHDAPMEAQAESALGQWHAGRRGPQMYITSSGLFGDRLGRRWFVAECSGGVVGMLSMLQVDYAGCRSLINRVFSAPAAPPHTNELMVVTALRALREEGAGLACLGTGPLAHLGRMEGFGGLSEFLARRIYRLVARVMHLHGRTAFWEKFGVARREPLYLLFQPAHIGISELGALLRTFHFSMP